ncbi:MAG: CarD family transcriptional regulator [Bacilli bacterium]|jgi:CarD family transcriptional regulator
MKSMPKQESTKFKVGDYVVHKNEGVCVITSVENKDFGAGIHEYYLMHPFFKNVRTSSTIMIPVENCTQIRKHISRADAEKLIRELSKTEDVWISESKKRKENFAKIINTGDLHSLCGLIRTIHFKKNEYADLKKSIPLTDSATAALAERLAFEELAIALGIKPENVGDYISSKLGE